jgi:hypothetical protein
MNYHLAGKPTMAHPVSTIPSQVCLSALKKISFEHRYVKMLLTPHS